MGKFGAKKLRASRTRFVDIVGVVVNVVIVVQHIQLVERQQVTEKNVALSTKFSVHRKMGKKLTLSAPCGGTSPRVGGIGCVAFHARI